MTNQPSTLAQAVDSESAALNQAGNRRAALLHRFAPYLRGNVLRAVAVAL